MAWVLVNCRSLTLDLLRRRASQRTGLKNLSEQGTDNGETTVAADELLDLLQEGTAVHKALSELAEIQRHLIALAYFNDMSHSEIAEAVQLPLGTVKSHIRRGLQKLRKSIEL
jgi:RNA polymerase sigma-70 factor (ECF subfamily)